MCFSMEFHALSHLFFLRCAWTRLACPSWCTGCHSMLCLSFGHHLHCSYSLCPCPPHQKWVTRYIPDCMHEGGGGRIREGEGKWGIEGGKREGVWGRNPWKLNNFLRKLIKGLAHWSPNVLLLQTQKLKRSYNVVQVSLNFVDAVQVCSYNIRYTWWEGDNNSMFHNQKCSNLFLVKIVCQAHSLLKSTVILNITHVHAYM